MALFYLLRSGFPTRLAIKVAEIDAPDLETATQRLRLLKGIPAAEIGRSVKDGTQGGFPYWVQSAASAMIDDPTARKPAAMRARRFNR